MVFTNCSKSGWKYFMRFVRFGSEEMCAITTNIVTYFLIAT